MTVATNAAEVTASANQMRMDIVSSLVRKPGSCWFVWHIIDPATLGFIPGVFQIS
jgi:hypothetical protein